MSDADIIVIGSGHNGLVAAAYLAVAGKKVLVLERNEWFGGGVVTRELTRPGFRHDQHSMSHIFIQGNPLLLPTTQLSGFAIGSMAQSHQFQHFTDTGTTFAVG